MAAERLRRRIEQLLDEAEEAISQHDWEVVRGHAQSVLALDPDNPDGIALIEAADRAVGTSDRLVAEPPSSHQSLINTWSIEWRDVDDALCRNPQRDFEGIRTREQKMDVQLIRFVATRRANELAQ